MGNRVYQLGIAGRFHPWKAWLVRLGTTVSSSEKMGVYLFGIAGWVGWERQHRNFLILPWKSWLEGWKPWSHKKNGNIHFEKFLRFTPY